MKPENEVGFLITKIHHLSGRIFSKLLKEHHIEINPGQGRILFALWDNDGISIIELAKRTQLGKSTLTSMLDNLESDGYLKRVPSKDDRRKVLIQLTEKNRALEKTYHEVSQEMIDISFKGFTDSEIKKFESFLTKSLANLINYENVLKE
ncbi:MAG: MarR family winged helix-turn-helix transcriptional regulator [Candidatus Thorarchaeota archaeon]